MRFALMGAGGFVARRHMAAIKAVGGELVAACDRHDSVGIIDSFAPKAAFFTEPERFDRHLEKLAARGEGVNYISIATPNYLHDAHCRLAMRLRADAICEKPVVIKPHNIDQLREVERLTNQRTWCVLQARLHPEAKRMKEYADTRPAFSPRSSVIIDYVTRRGAWYGASWKGDRSRSGGVATNIGVHLFDLVSWCFGAMTEPPVICKHTPTMVKGRVVLADADVQFRISVDEADLPAAVVEDGGFAVRSFDVDTMRFDFSRGFETLHDETYREILAGRGFGLRDATPGVSIAAAVMEACS